MDNILQYLNNILHIFTSTLSVILVSIVNFLFFKITITPHFLISIVMIISSLFIYYLDELEYPIEIVEQNYEIVNQIEKEEDEKSIEIENKIQTNQNV